MLKMNKKIGIIGVIIGMIVLLNFVSASTYINSCQVLNKTGETYILTSDVSTSGICFDIQANDVTINCNNHTIRGWAGVQVSLYFPPISYNNLHIDNCVISGGIYNVYLENSKNAVIKNSDLTNVTHIPGQTTATIFLTSWSDISVYNTKYNFQDEWIGTGSLKRYYYLDIKTTDASNPLKNVSVIIKDKSNNTIFSGLTNSNGEIPRQELIEYNVSGNVRTYLSPYQIFVSGGGIYNGETITFDLNESKNLIFDLEVNENLSSVTVDKKNLELGESAIFTINLTSDLSDLNYSDGFYSEHYIGWVFTNENGDVIESKQFEKINNTYLEIKTITPPEIGNYSLMAFIIEYNQSYNKQTEEWTTSPEIIKIQRGETISVTKTSIPETPIPAPPIISSPNVISWFLGILQTIWDWFKSLFTM